MSKYSALDGTEKFNFALTLIGYLQNSSGASSISEISEHFRVRPDQVREVIHSLNVLELQLATGIELPFLIDLDEDNPDEIYLSQNLVATGVPRLTARQASAIAVGLDYLTQLPGFMSDPELAQLQKLLASGEVIETSRLLDVAPGSIEASAEQLREAILDRRQITCEYRNNRGELSKRNLQPLRLDIRPEGHYLRAWCNDNQDVRTFKLDRMRSIQVSYLQAQYSLEDFPQLSSDVYISQKTDVEIEVELAPEAYELAAHLKELPKPDESGWIRVKIRLGHLENLPRLIASFGGKARVVGPEVARQSVRDFAARALNKPIELGEISE